MSSEYGYKSRVDFIVIKFYPSLEETSFIMTIFSFACFLGLVVFAYSARCPTVEELMPCECQKLIFLNEIIVTCDGSTERNKLSLEDLKKPLKSLEGKGNVELRLTSVNLGTIPSNFFKGIQVQMLRLTNCDLDSLTDGNKPFLSGVENSLEELHIYGCFKKDHDLTQLQFRHLTKLRDFRLYFNSIKEVSNKWFEKGPASLLRVYLSNNRFEAGQELELGDRAFADLPNLVTLLLNDSSISSIERGMLPSSANHLRQLDLDNNALETLPEGLFRNLPALIDVSLSSNGITILNKDAWESVWEQLRIVNLRGNPLVCDSNMDWMFRLKAPSVVSGTCDSPTRQKGRSLKDYINNKGK